VAAPVIVRHLSQTPAHKAGVFLCPHGTSRASQSVVTAFCRDGIDQAVLNRLFVLNCV